jgi:hypothetical protein
VEGVLSIVAAIASRAPHMVKILPRMIGHVDTSSGVTPDHRSALEFFQFAIDSRLFEISLNAERENWNAELGAILGTTGIGFR